MASNSEDLSLPRILCLHGGGVTGAIFRAQFRSFLRALDTRFRFVFVDAPFLCDEGVGVAPVYSDWGPFRRWFRWLPAHDVKSTPTPACTKSSTQFSVPWMTIKGLGHGLDYWIFSRAKLASPTSSFV